MQSYLFKYIVVGDSSVGKSCILLQFLENHFSPDHESTIGVEFGCKSLTSSLSNIKLQIWDTAGQETFKSITRAYYRGSICCILVYDITNRDSFNNCVKWLEEIHGFTYKDITIVLVGNKSDQEESRQISCEDGKEFAFKNNLLFFETSAKTGENIEKVFNESAEIIYKKIETGQLNPSENFGIKIVGEMAILSRDKNKPIIKKMDCSC